MVASHPYNTWPLRVKFFTEAANKAWREINKNSQEVSLPLGFTSTVELEGVDGRSGKVGSGRTGPMNVTDGNLYSLTDVWGLEHLLHRNFHAVTLE